jgi:CO/xanthine dehydrogenase Mo-binding subunit
MGLVPTAAAIANAVKNATGARVHRIPLTPERVLTEIDATQRVTEVI